jgi:hypothetical protein
MYEPTPQIVSSIINLEISKMLDLSTPSWEGKIPPLRAEQILTK